MELELIDNETATKSQRFRWQLKGRNGKIVAASSEGFSTAEGCEENVIRTVEGLYNNVTVMRDRFSVKFRTPRARKVKS